jgi:hypothetical protein
VTPIDPAVLKTLALPLLAVLCAGCTDFQATFDERVQAEFRAQPMAPAPPLTEADLARLPPPVQRYVRASGALGRPRVQNLRIEFDAEMHQKPGDSPFSATSVQYNFVGRPARLFLMSARMYGLPVKALHLYGAEQATFQVRVASLVNMVDQQGEVMSRGETVTLLNDLCVFAPGALADPHLAWEPVDERSARVAYTNGRHRVSATLLFNERDELVGFTSDDRPGLQDGKLVQATWSTPISGYQVRDGLRLPTRGSAVYRYPAGDFTYGRFTLKSLSYDVTGPSPATRDRR